MTTLTDEIEGMRQRMMAEGPREVELVTALGQALAYADERLLKAIRLVAAQHDARRGEIGTELRALATRIGTLPVPPIEERFVAPRILRDGPGPVEVTIEARGALQ